MLNRDLCIKCCLDYWHYAEKVILACPDIPCPAKYAGADSGEYTSYYISINDDPPEKCFKLFEQSVVSGMKDAK